MIPTELAFTQQYEDGSGVQHGVRLKECKGGKEVAIATPGYADVYFDLPDIHFYINALIRIRDSQEMDVPGPEAPSCPGFVDPDELNGSPFDYDEVIKKLLEDAAKEKKQPWPGQPQFPGQDLYRYYPPYYVGDVPPLQGPPTSGESIYTTDRPLSNAECARLLHGWDRPDGA